MNNPRISADATGTLGRSVGYGITEAEGLTVPPDTTPGYANGARFYKLDGGVGAQVYVNQGTNTSCAFKPLPDLTAISTIGGAGVVGVASGYKVARGVSTITGTGTVVTGLNTVVAVVATMQADASLTNGTTTTATIGDQAGTPAAGSVILKVWKPTGSGDATPIASAAAVAVNWIAIGT